MTYFELFDQTTGNLVADFDSEADAFAFLVKQRMPLSAVRGLEVLRVEDGRLSVAATSDVIIDRLSPSWIAATTAIELDERVYADVVLAATGTFSLDISDIALDAWPEDSFVLTTIGTEAEEAPEWRDRVGDRSAYSLPRPSDEPAPGVSYLSRVA